MRNLHATQSWPKSGDSMCKRARVSQDSAVRAPEETREKRVQNDGCERMPHPCVRLVVNP